MSVGRKWWLSGPQYRTGKQRKYVDRLIVDEAAQGISDVILSECAVKPLPLGMGI